MTSLNDLRPCSLNEMTGREKALESESECTTIRNPLLSNISRSLDGCYRVLMVDSWKIPQVVVNFIHTPQAFALFMARCCGELSLAQGSQ